MRNSDAEPRAGQAGVGIAVRTEVGKEPRQDGPIEAYAKVAHRNTAARGPKGEKMSDAAFRAWVALDRWAWKDECPTNAQVAAACDWFDESGKPAAWKAKRALRELESLGKAKRVTTKSETGLHQREAIKLVRPYDHGAPVSQGWGAGAQGGGAPAPPFLRSRCRKKGEEPEDEFAGEGNSAPERQRQEPEPEPTAPPPPGPGVIPPPAMLSDIGRMPTEAERIRNQEEARRKANAYLATLKAERLGATPSTPAAAPAPATRATTTRPAKPTRPAEPAPIDVSALTAGMVAFLATLSADERAAFDSLPVAVRAKALEPHRSGHIDDPIIRRETMQLLGQVVPPAPALEMPRTVPELLANLRDGPREWVQLATEALVQDFGTGKDRKLWSGFNAVTLAVWRGEFPAAALVDAHRQGMKPESKNRGAVFNTALQRDHGWVWGEAP